MSNSTAATIPVFFSRLLVAPGAATLSVLGKDGSIQSTLVWPDFDGELLKLNMVSGSVKERSLRRELKATLLVAHSSNENMYISLRCEVEKITAEGAIDHLDMLTERNLGLSNWYGEVEAEDAPSKAGRVIVYLKPVRIYHT